MPTLRQIRHVYKPVLFGACLLPLAWVLAGAFEFHGLSLGPNPVEKIQDTFGIWALRLILLTLAITPLRLLTGQAWLLRFRRMLGLFGFSYAALHFLNYLVLDQMFDFRLIMEDITKRPFITIGFSALLLLIPLAITSTSGWRRRLGKRWQQLHYAVYLIGILVCWHFYWQVKKDIREPLFYIGALTLLLIPRLVKWRRHRQRARLPRMARENTSNSPVLPNESTQ